MMTGQDIVCFANDWEADPTSKHQVMKILARSNRVLWVNSIGLRAPGASLGDASRMLRKLRQFSRGPVRVADGLHVLTPLAVPFHGTRWAEAVNAWLVGRYVRRQARRLGMGDVQLWAFLPTSAPFVRQIRPRKLVYYCVDEWSAFSFLDPALMEERERQLIAQSDLVVASARALYERKRRLHPRTCLVPHGVDGELFAGARAAAGPVAPALAGLPRPIIGFWGLIHEWIDTALIAEVAARRPRWSFVLVGRVGVDCPELRARPNVYLPGPCRYEDLPRYARGFAAAILPFKLNRLTEHVNPIKLREYLAAGLPVVATPLAEARPYADVVRLAATPEVFTAALDEAVRDDGDAAVRRRMEAVREETWLARVEQLSALVEASPERSWQAAARSPRTAQAPRPTGGSSPHPSDCPGGRAGQR